MLLHGLEVSREGSTSQYAATPPHAHPLPSMPVLHKPMAHAQIHTRAAPDRNQCRIRDNVDRQSTSVTHCPVAWLSTVQLLGYALFSCMERTTCAVRILKKTPSCVHICRRAQLIQYKRNHLLWATRNYTEKNRRTAAVHGQP
jgi:hypothetical protein